MSGRRVLGRAAGVLAALDVAWFSGYAFFAGLQGDARAASLAWLIGCGVVFHLALGAAAWIALRRRGPGEIDAPIRWRGLGLAAVACWGPFAVLAGFVEWTLSRADFRETAWRLLPVGPGFLPAVFLWKEVLGLRVTEAMCFGSAAALTLAAVAAVAALAQRGGRWAFGAPAAALAGFAAVAVVTLRMLRM